MTTTNLNIRIDREIKDKSENIFAELGLNNTVQLDVQSIIAGSDLDQNITGFQSAGGSAPDDLTHK